MDTKYQDHNVELISYTPHALELLIYTKNTRLQGGETMADIIEWPVEKKLEHLKYMLGTIKSSWEFVDYVFRIKGVTRAFTHQLVRTRTGSYAQEAMRVVGPEDGVAIPPSLSKQESIWFDLVTKDTLTIYAAMVDDGMAPQDARGILPTNVKTSIIAKFNLRTIHDTANLRLCTRTQGEYQAVFRSMRDCIIKVHPWAKDFINVFCVNHGHCCFPNYKDCPIKKQLPSHFDPDYFKVKQSTIQMVWEGVDYEASPQKVDGETKCD